MSLNIRNLALATAMTAAWMSLSAFGPPPKPVKVAVEHGSTAAWEFAAMEELHLDEMNGVKLKVRKVADSGAGQDLLKAGRVEVILSPFDWASEQRSGGADLTFVPDTLDPRVAEQPPLLGWVFSEQWAAKNPDAINNFLDASFATRQALLTDDALWDKIRDEMDVADDTAFLALRDAYRAGVVKEYAGAEAAEAGQVQLLAQYGAAGDGADAAAGTFWTGYRK